MTSSDLFLDRYYTLALRYLQRRPRSKKEIYGYLRKKKASEVNINIIIEKLKQQNFINDSEFTKWWIDQRTRFRPKARRVIVLELIQKGIPREIIDSIYSADDEVVLSDKEKAIAIVKKKKNRYNNLELGEIYKKLGAYLTRRGFDYDTVKESIDEVFVK